MDLGGQSFLQVLFKSCWVLSDMNCVLLRWRHGFWATMWCWFLPRHTPLSTCHHAASELTSLHLHGISLQLTIRPTWWGTRGQVWMWHAHAECLTSCFSMPVQIQVCLWTRHHTWPAPCTKTHGAIARLYIDSQSALGERLRACFWWTVAEKSWTFRLLPPWAKLHNYEYWKNNRNTKEI